MPVGRLVTPGGNGVNVDVERARRRRVEGEPGDTRLLPRFAERDPFRVPFTRLGVAAGLEPAPELPVVKEQDAITRRGHHDRAGGEVPFQDPAVEGIGMAVEEGQNLGHVRGFLPVRREVPSERLAETRGAWRSRHPSNHPARPGARRRRAASLATPNRLPGETTISSTVGRRGVRCQQRNPDHPESTLWHTPAMGLGRTTRFASLPPGARRVSVMRAGAGGVKALAPSDDLLAEFLARKKVLVRAGSTADAAHAEAHRAMDYRTRYLDEVRARPDARAALRDLVAEARAGDVYLMCMCPYRTPGRACHTYALLDLARELDPSVRELPEPAPRGAKKPKSGSDPDFGV
jgi:hypothetical protein